MAPDDAVAGLLLAVGSGLVLSVAVLLIVYKMVDGHIPFGAGLCSLILIVLAMALAMHPPHPAVPGVILVSSLSLMAFFPFAEQRLEEFELRGVDAMRLAKSYKAVEVRPDNFAAKFELAKILHDHGFVAHAVQLASDTLATLSQDQDEIKNQSLRDVFHREQALLKRWRTEPQNAEAVKCPSCGAYNRPTDLFCTGCKRPYLLDVVSGQEVKSRVWAKLVVSWTALELFIPGIVAIGMNLEGLPRVGAFIGALAGIGGLIAWLFRPPKHAVAIWRID